MGHLRNKIFLQHVNDSLAEVRADFINKYTLKKENRFFYKGITYEIGPCEIDAGDFIVEISSKIPHDLLPKRIRIELYFKKVVSIVRHAKKKPADSKMENIIHNTSEMEFKERDYVKLTYRFRENELYTIAEVERRLRQSREKNIPLPNIPGVATASGKLVIATMQETMTREIHQLVKNFIKANEEVKSWIAKSKAAATPSAKNAKKKSAVKKKKTTVKKKKKQ